MNMLPSVVAYIAERVAQLECIQPYPIQLIRELNAVSALCVGLGQQAKILDKFLKDTVPLKGSEKEAA